jgi:3-deoxy-D-manno-octulosonic-acid transferase
VAVFLYNIFLFLFRVATHLASPFNPKAKKWVKGRKDIFRKLEEGIPADEKIIWVHCASLGEFEQGRPVIESLKAQGTGHKILLTFFSPSGYEAQKNYKGADWVFYLPMDGARNARRFLEIVHPSLVIFVKYEFWYYYLKKTKYRNIPLLLISALFRKDMSFFKWYGGLQRKILSRFDHLFVQNGSSKKLLDDIGLADITSVSGDTRFDRVSAIAERFEPIPAIEQFAGNGKVIVAGSTWKEDEELLQQTWEFLHTNTIKLIIAPHEIDPKNIDDLQQRFPNAALYSSFSRQPHSAEHSVLIIDNIGMLSRLYKYAWCCYVGGGLSRAGIHNVLEAAVYSKPVFFGPYYEKYQEAINLVGTKGAYSIKNEDEFVQTLQRFITEPSIYNETATKAGNFVKANTGAVEKIIHYIQEKRLLTN